jgi:hypothetical protein
MHTGGGGGEGEGRVRVNIGPPQANFKTFVNKNAIKPKIGGHLWQFFLKALTPIGILAKNIRYPLPWFSTRVHLFSTCNKL